MSKQTRHYTKEFKQEAIRLYESSGKCLPFHMLSPCYASTCGLIHRLLKLQGPYPMVAQVSRPLPVSLVETLGYAT
jgi:hypothetical protein